MSLIESIAAESAAESSAAPVRLIAESDCGDYVIGTRSTDARASLLRVSVKDGVRKYKGVSQLASIADAMSADWTDAESGEAIDVF